MSRWNTGENGIPRPPCSAGLAAGTGSAMAKSCLMTSISRPRAEPRSAYRAFRDIATRWSDNDVYGHVNNVVYYSWFDTAVNGLLIDRGALDIHAGSVIGLVIE